MSENMTVCPECGAEFDTIREESEENIQVLRQQCPDCEYTVDVGIINYYQGKYEVVAPAVPGDICNHREVTASPTTRRVECGEEATIRRQMVGHTVEGRCEEHLWEIRKKAMDRTDLLD